MEPLPLLLEEGRPLFENVLHQDASSLLAADIMHERLPQSLLLSGPAFSGKLTTALEIARVLSCQGEQHGDWLCTCSSCLKHKSLVSTDLLIAGNRSCTPEISAARNTLLEAVKNHSTWIQAARYLFVRSVRKLTNRFNQVLWDSDDKVSKIAPVMASIDELLEELDPLRELSEFAELEKSSAKLEEQCTKLESSFMYDSIPVSQIRKASAWARYTINQGKRVFIIENADRMQESVRNALLKILEEPPAQSVFILTAERRNAVMPTILSRVRTYSFPNRTDEQNSEVLQRIFHANDEYLLQTNGNSVGQGTSLLGAYLNSFLPASPDVIAQSAAFFVQSLQEKGIPDIESLVKQMKNFEPRIMLKLFFNKILDIQRGALISSDATECALNTEQGARVLCAIRTAYENITIYNQSPSAALESLTYSVLKGE